MTSEASSSVNLLDAVSEAGDRQSSMASSPSYSLISEADRASPFLPASALNSTPSSPSPYLRQIDFGASTSRSSLSLDSSRCDFAEQLAQNVVQYRRRRRTNSSDSSGSDEGSVGAASHVSSLGGFSRSQDNDDDAEGSRKTSMETPIRQADMPRGRLANIRRESSCTPSDEMAHERLTTAGIQVSTGWDDALRIGGAGATAAEEAAAAAVSSTSSGGSTTVASPVAAAAGKDEELIMRRRAPSASSGAALSELSILTQAWIPHSCSPSPTRMSESTKQCYSPSTQKIVRANIPYSPSPSPTASPTRKRLMTARSQSPIASRSALKRRVDCMLPSSPVSSPMSNGSGGAGIAAAAAAAFGGIQQHQVLQGSSITNGCVSSSSSSSSAPPPEKRACPGGAMSGGYVRNSTSPLVTMDARAAAAASAIRRHSLFLVDPEIRRASTESYSDVDPTSVGGVGDGVDSISEPSSVLMPSGIDDSFDPDALLFRAPSVPPPLSVGSNCSSKYEAAATDADDTKSTIDGDEEKMDDEGSEDPNTSTSSSSLLDTSSKKDEESTPPECIDADDVSQKEEVPIAAMEE
ncbi:hypothetical protein PMAYCL1PPCAC_00226 [Pristionchus mayeri]|uniref:Uncharacterized protein n=1 Tax=Pristionchus mayeri TaxID=1317129 RepID=A0AAN4YX59_9BILA|nr:hypothetical protein PMAYCL1PPCAC_00226 [Pristionchus mayeri]